MNAHDISNAKDPDVRASLVALRRAAQQARQTAIQTETNLVIVKDGQMQRISAEGLRQQTKALHTLNRPGNPGGHLVQVVSAARQGAP